MKFMNQRLRYNLQFHAGVADGDGSDGAGDGDDDQADDDQDDKDSGDKGKKSDKKYFTQEELDKAIKARLKRERENQKKQDQGKEDKESGKGDDKSKATDDKVSALEAKLLCFEHDVAKDCVTDVVALAKAYVDEDTNFEEAIEKVIKKYPQFVKGSGKGKGSNDTDDDEDETDNKKSWGQRQKGNSGKVDGVEAAFLKRNPGLKID